MAESDTLTSRLAADLDGVFPEVVRLLTGGLYSGALRMLGNREDAEDVTQEALVRAYRALASYPAERIEQLRLRGWVWTIAANLCRNRLRRRARRPEAAEPPRERADPAAGPDDEVIGSELAGELGALLLTLPWSMRHAVVLRHVVGLSSEEIAEAVGRPASTVRSDIRRGLSRLRDLYTGERP